MVVPKRVSFQFSRMSMPPKILPTVSLLGPVSAGGGTSKSSLPSRFVKGQDRPMAWRSSWSAWSISSIDLNMTRNCAFLHHCKISLIYFTIMIRSLVWRANCSMAIGNNIFLHCSSIQNKFPCWRPSQQTIQEVLIKKIGMKTLLTRAKGQQKIDAHLFPPKGNSFLNDATVDFEAIRLNRISGSLFVLHPKAFNEHDLEGPMLQKLIRNSFVLQRNLRWNLSFSTQWNVT